MNVELPWLETVLKKHERIKRVAKVTAASCQMAVGKGENYMSITERVQVSVILSSGAKSTRSLIVKTPPSSEQHQKFLKENAAFINEINVYKNILKNMNEVIELSGDTKEPLWCEMIAHHPYDMIILEDLCVKGFKTINRKNMMDFEHGCLVMASLGRFHALSLALVRDGVIRQGDFTQYIFNEGMIARKSYSLFLGVMLKAMKSSWGAEWNNVITRLEKFKDTVEDQMSALREPPNLKLKVLNHGDCWSNNIMIRTAGLGETPVEVKFVDFQAIHYNSLAWDVTYFLYTSMIPSVRRTRFSELLQSYMDSLKKHMAIYGVDDANAVPTIEEVQSELSRIKLFGLLMIVVIHAMTTAETNRTVDMERYFSNTGDPEDSFNPEIYTSPKFRNNVGEDFLQFMKEDFF